MTILHTISGLISIIGYVFEILSLVSLGRLAIYSNDIDMSISCWMFLILQGMTNILLLSSSIINYLTIPGSYLLGILINLLVLVIITSVIVHKCKK